MSLIDDARLMASMPARSQDHGNRCFWCDEILSYPGPLMDEHADDCPWLAMPKIVAALEAAEALTVAYEEARILFGAPLGYRFKALCERLDEALDA